MSMVTVFAGLDHHRDSVQVCVMDRAGSVLINRRCPNSRSAIQSLVCRRGRRVRAAIEAFTAAWFCGRGSGGSKFAD